MSVQLLLLASLPALGWGLMPIVAKLMGGKSEEQLLGTTARNNNRSLDFR